MIHNGREFVSGIRQDQNGPQLPKSLCHSPVVSSLISVAMGDVQAGCELSTIVVGRGGCADLPTVQAVYRVNWQTSSLN
jgi:hypothetical protein